jgi:hypothetical protein
MGVGQKEDGSSQNRLQILPTWLAPEALVMMRAPCKGENRA